MDHLYGERTSGPINLRSLCPPRPASVTLGFQISKYFKIREEDRDHINF